MFKCHVCRHTSHDLDEHLTHQKNYHSNISKFLYCGFNQCSKSFRNKQILASHLIKAHGFFSEHKIFHQPYKANPNGKFVCSVALCKKEFDNHHLLIKHLKVHIKDGQEIKCPFENCSKSFTIISSFTSHVTKKHKRYEKSDRESLQLNYDNHECHEPHPSDNHEFHEPHPNDINDGTFENHNCQSRQIDDVEESSINDLFLLNVAQFYLKLESEFLLPASTIQYIVTHLKNIHEQGKELFCNQFKEYLRQSNVDPNLIENYCLKLFENNPYAECDNHLMTDYKRKQFYKKNFDYVDPVKEDIDKNENTFFAYVPILETLKKVFADNSVKNELNLNADNKFKANILTDFYDGYVYKNNKFFKNNPNSLKIILY
uniref:C2H2-type domain-containing protein n=1 Tax=Trichogramma kaykai TaxID=54128 RepID=A0ABD2XNP3_9HYME